MNILKTWICCHLQTCECSLVWIASNKKQLLMVYWKNTNNLKLKMVINKMVTGCEIKVLWGLLQ